MMIKNVKEGKSQVNVFKGSPWEISVLINLLNAAYLHASIVDNGSKNMNLVVPSEEYTAAVKVINDRERGF